MINSMCTVINGKPETITPNHDTVLINGIEIDKEISGLISFLWSNKIQTMRSCQDANGYIYISFLNLKDALKSGLSLFNSFMVKVVTNDHNGGYASIAVFSKPCLLRDKFEITTAPKNVHRVLNQRISKTVKAFEKSGFLDVLYRNKNTNNPHENPESIGKKFLDLGGSFNMYVVSNNDGKIAVDMLSK